MQQLRIPEITYTNQSYITTEAKKQGNWELGIGKSWNAIGL